MSPFVSVSPKSGMLGLRPPLGFFSDPSLICGGLDWELRAKQWSPWAVCMQSCTGKGQADVSETVSDSLLVRDLLCQGLKHLLSDVYMGGPDHC